MEVGQTKVFTLTPLAMLSGRSYLYQQAMVTGYAFRTKYNRKTQELSVTRTS